LKLFLKNPLISEGVVTLLLYCPQCQRFRNLNVLVSSKKPCHLEVTFAIFMFYRLIFLYWICIFFVFCCGGLCTTYMVQL